MNIAMTVMAVADHPEYENKLPLSSFSLILTIPLLNRLKLMADWVSQIKSKREEAEPCIIFCRNRIH